MALRAGLDAVLAPPASKAYRTKPRPLGLREGSATTTSQNCCVGGRRGPFLILVDTNILLYAEDSLSEHHEAARVMVG